MTCSESARLAPLEEKELSGHIPGRLNRKAIIRSERRRAKGLFRPLMTSQKAAPLQRKTLQEA